MKKVTGKQGWVISFGILMGLIVLAGVAYAMDVAAHQGKVPRGVSVGGVDISTMDREAAVAKLSTELADVASRPVSVQAGARQSSFVPADAGLSPNFAAAVAGIPDESLNPFTRLASLVRPLSEHAVAFDIDAAAFATAMDRVEEELTTAPKDGDLDVTPDGFNVTEPVLGQSVERAELDQAVQDQWLDPAGVKVDATEVEPAVNTEAIESMRKGPAAQALDKDIVVHGREGVDAVLDRAARAEFVSIAREDGALHLNVDVQRARELLAEGLAASEVQGTNAKLSFAGGTRQVTPSVDGTVVDWDKTLEGFEDRVRGIGGAAREFAAEYKPEPATFTTEMAQNATFDQVVGEFTTSGYSAASGENIRIVAQTVNGAIVGPGETFSLNGYTGPRGTAQGYVESGVIIDGRGGTAVGGGISQFATTLYNAAYFAGMDDAGHTAHSYYISRYPAGREATVYEGAIDLRFTNSSPHPVRIDTIFGGGEITVRLMGVKTVNVESTNNGRWAHTQPTRKQVSGPNCQPSGGAPGFTTSDTRTIRDLSGNVLRQETQTTVYDPQPIVSCD
ncbi:VanW family protein [Corynebacterium lizhenjunii]|uniref:VanW family protein n=1 Tax=Corynebacterium lizhenjunii TaxID=2709394 RepID=UPI00197E9B40|nr:VanW family protein [Corynebacterium lizhenjunii]